MNYLPSLAAIALLASTLISVGSGLHVYDPVPNPGVFESNKYEFKVREVSVTPITWQTPFPFLTKCTPDNGVVDQYFSEFIGNWSNTYINFEISEGTDVEIEIAKEDGTDISTARVLPEDACRQFEIRDGKVYVIIDRPVMFTVDIDNQLDQKTGILSSQWGDFYDGDPIHTVTVFANPFINDKPVAGVNGAHGLAAGTTLDPTVQWTTLIFEPGVHDIGIDFPIKKNRSYYIPGDAIVRGTFNNNGEWAEGQNVRFFGHGTLTGEGITHPKDITPAISSDDYHKYRPIEISGAKNAIVEGITITDSAYHSMGLFSNYDDSVPSTQSVVKWTKIMTWRANGDGLYPGHNTLVEDCFFRTADDCIYTMGQGIRRCLFWNDVNGSSFVLSPVGVIQNPKLMVEDCVVLYNRSVYANTQIGSGVFNMRGRQQNPHAEFPNAHNSELFFRNIKVLDNFPNTQPFLLQTGAAYIDAPTYNYGERTQDAAHIRFENIEIAAGSHLGHPLVLWGTPNASFDDVIFNNVTVAGVAIDALSHFAVNEADPNDDYLDNIQFNTFTTETIAFDNTSGDLTWETVDNWQASNAPDYLDRVDHTSVSDTMTVDSTQQVDILTVSHNSGSTLKLLSSGDLEVNGFVEVGNVGSPGASGTLVVDGGSLRVEGDIDFGKYGTRTAVGDIDNGFIETQGRVTVGGWNADAVGTVTVTGYSTWVHGGNEIFKVGGNGPGTVTLQGAHVNILSTAINPLRVGEYHGAGILNVEGSSIYTEGLAVGSGSPTGTGTINLSDGGAITVDSDTDNRLQVHASGFISIAENSAIHFKGDKRAYIATLVAADKILCADGSDPTVTYDSAANFTKILGSGI